ncbi:MAG TPA: hypothetical protein VFE80_13945, partial [Beijerinckiaceae bacterium]|nr:hypothetical protein [Beijerinckiaceae bacterium]
ARAGATPGRSAAPPGTIAAPPLACRKKDDLAHRIAGSLPESLAKAGKRERGGAAEEEGLAS